MEVTYESCAAGLFGVRDGTGVRPHVPHIVAVDGAGVCGGQQRHPYCGVVGGCLPGRIVAVVADLVMSVLGILSLSFAGEAVLCNASLVVLSVLSGGLAYLVWAVAAPTIALVKAIEEFAGHHSEGHFWPRIHAN